MTNTKSPRTLSAHSQRVAASDAVLFGGPYNVLEDPPYVVERHLPEECVDWTIAEQRGAVEAVCVRAVKFAEAIVARYGRS